MISCVTATIDLSALQHNVRQVRLTAPGRKIIAVIKANGYGHGLLRMASALSGVDAFAVARLDEAMQLRKARIDQDIIILEGCSDALNLNLIAEHSFQLVVHHLSQLTVLESVIQLKPIDVWLKIDSGMHRMGVPPGLAQSAWWRLQDSPIVKNVRLMTHLACADDLSDEYTQKQIACFKAATAGLVGERSIANSAGILGWSESHCDWVRPGIMLYGISPFTADSGQSYDLKPVMTLSSRLIAVNQFNKGDAIGYGASWVCPENMPVGIVACGYGDGYPRHAEPGTPVLVNGQCVSLIGRVSMDSICVDLRTQPQAKIGDPAVLWGDGLAVEEVAAHASTIPYELLCRVSQRTRFITKK